MMTTMPGRAVRTVVGLLTPTAFVLSPAPVANTSPPEQATVEQRILDLTNEERARAGCPAVRLNPALSQAARNHSVDMAQHNFFDHRGSNGSDHIQRAQAAGYPSQYVAENIAAGQPTPEATFQQWMGSEGHRANILNCEFTELGLGYVAKSGTQYTHYWSQELGNPDL